MGNMVTNGNPTSTRGVVIATDSTNLNMGKYIALHGDHATCGNCGPGSWPIIASANYMRFHGRAVVQDGDLVACPCGRNRVIATSEHMRYDNLAGHGNSVGSESANAGNAINPAMKDETDDEVIVQSFSILIDGVTPVDDYRYDLYSDGAVHTKKGRYSNGETVSVQGETALRLVTWLERDLASKYA